ncbi:PREDICTED: uncharacterized protein LOC109220549 [Nicotiana attenuata]|uniref:HMA domain-containing protein n=1 Tax=Nicotiana attenuata TaxID=49451 RepID=A0A1J6JUK7_NICAT|nr:PREDICTED: uncharacterized protein LOC109220549 [Nicotiana attenuata]OIT20172.1 hypothetical protein A4A49_40317 [Nicotiana attenuata]
MFATRNNSMAYSLVSPNTFALKLKLHCKDCERKVRNLLLKIQGVHSVKIDEKLGNVVISGTVDPATILTILEKLGRKAEILWEQGTPVNNSAKNVQIITQSEMINPLNDPDIMTQLEPLSGIPGLKTVEVIKTIKLTFQEERNDPGNTDNNKSNVIPLVGYPANKILEISNTKNVNRPHRHVLPHDHYSDGGGFCAASSSCCGGHAAINLSHNLYGCGQYGGNTSVGSCWGNSRNCCCQPPMGNWGRAWPPNSQLPPVTTPPWSNDTIASAPPLPSDYYRASLPPPPPPPPPFSPIPHTYYSALSDENVNGCIIQ